MTTDNRPPVDEAPSEPPAESAPLSAEQSLEESEKKYQRLVEGISGDYVIYTHGPTGVITYVSPSIHDVLGYPVESVLGLNWRDLIGEKFVGREQADRVAGEVATGKDFYQFKVEISHADGSTRFVEIQQRPLFDAAGQYISMEGIAKDITEATRNAEQLQELREELELRVVQRTVQLNSINDRLSESEDRYRSVVNCQTEFVVRWLPGAVFTFVNQAFCRLVGRSSEELTDWCFLLMIHPDDSAAFEEGISQLSRENPLVTLESRIVLADESQRWTVWTNQILFDDNDEFLEYQSVGRDITELKEANDLLREKETSLAHVSRLANMSELVAGIAHEIHQPLHAAKTFAEAARRNLEIGEAKNIATAIDCANEISAAITRTATILRRLREFTRSRPVSFELLDLNQVVEGACEMLAFEARKAQVSLKLEPAADLPAIEGDSVLLGQVCVNVILNAIEAMEATPAEQRKLTISTGYNSQFVSVRFCDGGCGLQGNTDKTFLTLFTQLSQRPWAWGFRSVKALPRPTEVKFALKTIRS